MFPHTRFEMINSITHILIYISITSFDNSFRTLVTNYFRISIRRHHSQSLFFRLCILYLLTNFFSRLRKLKKSLSFAWLYVNRQKRFKQWTEDSSFILPRNPWRIAFQKATPIDLVSFNLPIVCLSSWGYIMAIKHTTMKVPDHHYNLFFALMRETF